MVQYFRILLRTHCFNDVLKIYLNVVEDATIVNVSENFERTLFELTILLRLCLLGLELLDLWCILFLFSQIGEVSFFRLIFFFIDMKYLIHLSNVGQILLVDYCELLHELLL